MLTTKCLLHLLTLHFFLLFGRSKAGNNDVENEGSSMAVKVLRFAINETVDPCEDFYQFSCGKWKSAVEIPKNFPKYLFDSNERLLIISDLLLEDKPSTSQAINKLKLLHSKCMDVNALKASNSSMLLKLIEKEFGYWPILHGEKPRAKSTLTGMNAESAEGVFVDDDMSIKRSLSITERKEFDFTSIMASTLTVKNAIFTMDYSTVFKTSAQFDLSQGDLFLKERKYYLNETYAEKLDAYAEYMRAKVALMAADAGLKRAEAEIAADVKAIIEFEKRLAEIMIIEDDEELVYDVGFFGLPDISAEFDWSRFFRLSPTKNSAIDKVHVLLLGKVYFEQLKQVLKTTDMRTVVNYLIWAYVDFWDVIADERYEFLRQELNQRLAAGDAPAAVIEPRWKRCLEHAGQMLYVGYALYAREHFTHEQRTRVRQIADAVVRTFRKQLSTNRWMDNATKESALKKVDELRLHLGFSDIFFNDSLLDGYFEGFISNVNNVGDLGAMIQQIIYAARGMSLKLLINPAYEMVMDNFGEIAKNQYDAIQNQVDIGYDAIKTPFFDESLPAALNYGGVGGMIGQTLASGFYSSFSGEPAWWSDGTIKRFQERRKCFTEQYRNSPSIASNGSVANYTVNEYDKIGSLRATFEAYQEAVRRKGQKGGQPLPGLEKYTSEQLFFINYGLASCVRHMLENSSYNVLAEKQLSINLAMANTPEFSVAFNCPVGSPMNPERKCIIF